MFLPYFVDIQNNFLCIMKISFTVASSYLLANERTLEELSKVVTEPVKMDNFRPNIVIDGLLPFEEVTIFFFAGITFWMNQDKFF